MSNTYDVEVTATIRLAADTVAEAAQLAYRFQNGNAVDDAVGARNIDTEVTAVSKL